MANGRFIDGMSLYGTWTGDDVLFPSFVEGADNNSSAHASGTYAPAEKKATGNLLNSSGATVGAWTLSDIQ